MSQNHHISYSHGAVCIIVQNEEIIFEQRATNRDGAGLIDFCSGHIDPNETPNITMRRELQEELGIPQEHSANIIFLAQHTLYLEKRREKNWIADFFYLEIPASLTLKPRTAEVSQIIRIPFKKAIKFIRNDGVQYPFTQIQQAINLAKQHFHQKNGRT